MQDMALVLGFGLLIFGLATIIFGMHTMYKEFLNIRPQFFKIGLILEELCLLRDHFKNQPIPEVKSPVTHAELVRLLDCYLPWLREPEKEKPAPVVKTLS